MLQSDTHIKGMRYIPRPWSTGPGVRGLLRPTILALLALAALALPLLGLRAVNSDAYGFASERPAPDFELRTATGEATTLADFQGEYVYLMFGYLNCPDVCHTQALLFEELRLLADPDLPLRFVYVAIDPVRDSPTQVARYFDFRGENFVSLHADDVRDLQALAIDYRAYFRPGRSSGSATLATIDHNGLFFLLGPDGRLRYTYTATQNATPLLIKDLQTLNHEYQTI